ncbi:NEDD8-conjugating enzyme Ubc12 [Bienertia sinuspersici]
MARHLARSKQLENYVFIKQPNYEDPLNHDAAAVLRDNPKMFESNVRRAMSGGYVGQTYFSRCIS